MDMRDYDPAIGRWLAIDPVTHFSQSPYNAFDGNPVFWADPSGADSVPINTWHYAGSGVNSGYSNFSSGDHMFGGSGDAFWIENIATSGSSGYSANITLDWNSFGNGKTTLFFNNGSYTGYSFAPPPKAKGIAIAHDISNGMGLSDSFGGSGDIFSAAVPIAITLASIDGPVPIGDVVGFVVLAGAVAYDANERTFVTYTMTNGFGKTYVGRTSGYGHPYNIMMNRYSGHHMRASGYSNPTLDRAVQGYRGYPAIRGREQQLIDFYGGVGSAGVGNSIRGVGAYNPAGIIYHEASSMYFGQLAPYTGFGSN